MESVVKTSIPTSVIAEHRRMQPQRKSSVSTLKQSMGADIGELYSSSSTEESSEDECNHQEQIQDMEQEADQQRLDLSLKRPRAQVYDSDKDIHSEGDEEYSIERPKKRYKMASTVQVAMQPTEQIKLNIMLLSDVTQASVTAYTAPNNTNYKFISNCM